MTFIAIFWWSKVKPESLIKFLSGNCLSVFVYDLRLMLFLIESFKTQRSNARCIATISMAGIPTGRRKLPRLPRLPKKPKLPKLPRPVNLPVLPEFPGLPDLPDVPDLPDFPELSDPPGFKKITNIIKPTETIQPAESNTKTPQRLEES